MAILKSSWLIFMGVVWLSFIPLLPCQECDSTDSRFFCFSREARNPDFYVIFQMFIHNLKKCYVGQIKHASLWSLLKLSILYSKDNRHQSPTEILELCLVLLHRRVRKVTWLEATEDWGGKGDRLNPLIWKTE